MSKAEVLEILLPAIEDSDSVRSNSDSLFSLGSPLKRKSSMSSSMSSPLAFEVQDPPKKMAKRGHFEFDEDEITKKRKRFQWCR